MNTNNSNFFSRRIPGTPMMAATAMALSVVSGLAEAQSNVTIWGIIDIGLLHQTKSNPNGKSQTAIESSGLRQTVLGFKGSEDLGNGLKAFFNLESHFDTDTGMLHGTGDAAGTGTPLFRRQANVGLSGDWGSVTLGRQYGPALLAHIGTEPRAFKEQFSNLYAWAYNQYAATAGAVGTERNTNNDVGIFFNNAIQYRHTLGPVNFGILWAPGGTPGSMSNNSIWALGAAYTGPVTLSASYQIMKDEATGTDNVKHSGLGMAVPYGDLIFKVNYLNAKNKLRTGADVSNVDAWGLGVDWKWHRANSMTVAYYDNKDKLNNSDHTRNWVLSNDFSLSKRTTLYQQVAFVDADKGATIKTSIVAAGIPRVDARTTLLNLGINHTF